MLAIFARSIWHHRILLITLCAGTTMLRSVEGQFPEPYYHDPPPALKRRDVPTRAPAQSAVESPVGPSNPVLSYSEQRALEFYRGSNAAKTLRSMPFRQTVEQPTTTTPRPTQSPNKLARKPFLDVHPEPTVSPYMNLFRDEDRFSAPNYFAFVRPQMQQIEVNRQQQAELRRLRLGLPSGPRTKASSAARRATGSVKQYQAHFRNTGQFFPTTP